MLTDVSSRSGGILLHITSLPGKEGIGTLGKEAHNFIDYLVSAGQKLWQILPINPTSIGDSPFQGPSVFAGNPNIISLENLVNVGDLDSKVYKKYLSNRKKYKSYNEGRSDNYVEYGFLWNQKLGFDQRDITRSPLIQSNFGFFNNKDHNRHSKFQKFCENNKLWLNDYAIFMSLKAYYGFSKKWIEWDETDRFRKQGYGKGTKRGLVEFFKYVQFIFDEQMRELYNDTSAKRIKLIGDVSIYPAYDSADVWANRELFQLDEHGRMTGVAAVPPDYFSEKGQLWGNPLYKWGSAGTEEDHFKIYEWWVKRFKKILQYHDKVKIDHFRGFVAYGKAPANHSDARETKWVCGPRKELFNYLEEKIGNLPVIAEDLGIITDNVRNLMSELGYPGMRIFMFADPNDYSHFYLPHNAVSNSVFYTGTHDNETFYQKLYQVMPESERNLFLGYLNQSHEEKPNWKAIDLLYQSSSNSVIIPMQDLLGLGPEGRMNNPSESSGWWKWRVSQNDLGKFVLSSIPKLKEISVRTNRVSNYIN